MTKAEPLTFPLRILALTIVALGLAAAYGTWRYLGLFLGEGPAGLAAVAIECGYIALAIVPAHVAGVEVMRTAQALVLASIVFNFGHAYDRVAPGALASQSARFDLLAVVQALAVAGFVPWIAFRVARVRTAIGLSTAEAAAPVESPKRKELDFSQLTGRSARISESENENVIAGKPPRNPKPRAEVVSYPAAMAAPAPLVQAVNSAAGLDPVPAVVLSGADLQAAHEVKSLFSSDGQDKTMYRDLSTGQTLEMREGDKRVPMPPPRKKDGTP